MGRKQRSVSTVLVRLPSGKQYLKLKSKVRHSSSSNAKMTRYTPVILATLVSIFTAVVTLEGENKIYMRAVQCNVSDEFFFRNFSCFAKSYSRSFSTANVKMTAKAPLFGFKVVATKFDQTFKGNSFTDFYDLALQIQPGLPRSSKVPSCRYLFAKGDNGKNQTLSSSMGAYSN